MTAMLDLTGKTAVVTGAAGGIGAATCRALARRGAAVVVSDRDRRGGRNDGRGLRSEGSRRTPFRSTSPTSAPSRRLRHVEATHGGPDILVNNAGSRSARADGVVARRVGSVQSVNVTGAFLCSREAASA
jgi:NAD(P)-dependent dehydrogenase (short-subunit alcohol dehydrogenase family)